MPKDKSQNTQDINLHVEGDAAMKGVAVGNDNQVIAEAKAGGHIVQAKDSEVTIVGGDHYAIQVYSLGVSEQGKVDWAAYRKQLRKERAQPYKFLNYYEITDADIFFGRDVVCDQIIEKLTLYKSVLINGKSGSGKSSLVNAGLIPRLMNRGYLTFVFRDYGYPTDLLKQALHGIPEFQLDVTECSDITDILSRMTSLANRPIAIFLDQFERFFENLPKQERQRFIQEIKTCLSTFSGEELDIVFSIREDFYGRIGEFWDAFPEFDTDSYKVYLKPLSPAEARDAIVKPLKGLPFRYEKGFVDDVLLPSLIGQTSGGEQIEPLHLQIVCNQLYDEARQRYVADLADGELVVIEKELYQEIGGTQGILHNYLDGFVERIAKKNPQQTAIVRSMLKLMIQTSGTRKFVSLHDLVSGVPDVPRADLEKFTSGLQESRVIETRGQEDTTHYSLFHEFMVKKVQSWYDERELERKKAEEALERGLDEWKNSQAVLNETQVAHIRTWLDRKAFDNAAKHLLTISQRKAQRIRWLKRWAVAMLIIFAAVPGIAAYLTIEARNDTLVQSVVTYADQHFLKGEREQAALLARQAYFLNDAYQANIEDQVRDVLRRSLALPEGETKEMIEQVCQQARRNLTPDEWQKVVKSENIPYESCPDLPGSDGAAEFVLRLRSEPMETEERQYLSLYVKAGGDAGTYIDNRFETQAEGQVIVGHATGLVWQQSGSGRMVDIRGRTEVC
ncbi:MAG: hypothetical protein GY792_31245 [Gammaproteobacteria bacterium]|nr:hypothetical protein [Gammaproteobacteria bacterium]